MAIFGHGFGDNKNSSPFVVASKLAQHGIATIAINVVGHGGGVLGTLTVNRTGAPAVTVPAGGRGINQDAALGSTTIDSTEGVNAAPPRTLIGSRDGLRQTVIVLMQLVRVIEVGMDVDGDGFADLDGGRIYYFGQSFGGIYGTKFVALDGSVRAGVPNVAGSPIIDVARLGGFRPLVAGALAARTPGLLNGGISGFNENCPCAIFRRSATWWWAPVIFQSRTVTPRCRIRRRVTSCARATSKTTRPTTATISPSR